MGAGTLDEQVSPLVLAQTQSSLPAHEMSDEVHYPPLGKGGGRDGTKRFQKVHFSNVVELVFSVKQRIMQRRWTPRKRGRKTG